jgi:hypothetical protein
MEIIVYLSDKQIKVISLNEDAKVKEILEVIEIVDHEGVKIFAFEEDEEFDEYHEVRHHKALVVHKCKKVHVEVLYPGLPAYSHSFSPAALVKTVRKEAIKKLGIDEEAGKKLELYTSQQQDGKLNSNYPIGHYLDGKTCSAKFYLLDPNAFQG